MSLIRFHTVTMQFDTRQVLREVNFRLLKGDRVGLIGKNGAGKTTVLKLILGTNTATGGAVDINPGMKIGYFSQFSDLSEDTSINEILDREFTHIHAIEKQLEELDATISSTGDEREHRSALRRQAELLEKMEQVEGWTYTNRIDTVLTKLGFNQSRRTLPIARLSGGWRNRAALARILIQEPDILLLDEPTNYLDVTGLSWLEQNLLAHRGALILVSHDRQFIDSVASRIIEVENYHFQEYSGNFTEYVRQKKLRFKTLRNQFLHEEELLILESEAISERQETARDPSRALQRKLAGIRKQAEPRPVDRIVTNIYEGLHAANDLCHIEDLSKAYDGDLLFRDVCIDVRRGDRVAVIGPNGCGKSTLLATLTGAVPSDTGRVKWPASGVPFCDFNRVLAELDPSDTVTHTVNVAKLGLPARRKAVNHFLELMQFSEQDLQARVGTLSGGQRARVALAVSLLSGAATLVMDEPTNHLDLTSIQVMERALVCFPGAVIVVSHDRFFIDKVATRLLVFRDAGLVAPVEGNWTTWATVARSRNVAATS